jgi:hypothetical protein
MMEIKWLNKQEINQKEKIAQMKNVELGMKSRIQLGVGFLIFGYLKA